MISITRCRLAKMYKNFSGNSIVAAYETGLDYIKVELRDGSITKYSFRTAGLLRVRLMKRLASHGIGLGTYIATNCRTKPKD